MYSHCILAVLLLLQAAPLAVASDGTTSRDANYIVSHRINPNVQDNQYYAESSNILMSLSNFDKLYVKFENCVWSTYDVDDDTCGPDGHEEYWYMGLTECFRANVAYSLYGVPKGKKTTGCSSANYIQSLFTTAGVEAFTRSLVATGKLSFSNSYNGDYGNADDDEVQNGAAYPGGISSTCYQNGTYVYNGDNRDGLDENAPQDTPYESGMTSFSLACNNKKFAMKSFKSAYCDPNAEMAIENTLDKFNSEIQKAQCIEIYDSSTWSGNNYYNGDQDDNVMNEDPLSLLYFSQTCNIRDYPGLCPDPYKKLSKYATAEERAYVQTYEYNQSRAIRASAIALLTAGILLMFLAVYTRLRASKLRIKIKLNRKKAKLAPVEGPDGVVDDGAETMKSNYGEPKSAGEQSL